MRAAFLDKLDFVAEYGVVGLLVANSADEPQSAVVVAAEHVRRHDVFLHRIIGNVRFEGRVDVVELEAREIRVIEIADGRAVRQRVDRREPIGLQTEHVRERVIAVEPVENVLLEHPSVLEAAVVGSPDDMHGTVPKAFIVLDNGYTPSDELKKALQEFVRRELAPYKYPRKIEFMP